jgi:hypothetical protein
MARKILFKQGAKSKATPNGYKSLIVDSNEQITLVGTSSQLTSFAKDAKPTTLIADAEFYTWGTYSIYPSNYLTTFKQSDNSFHLVEMLTKLPTHDFFDNDLESELVFGIFKENESQLNFCGAFDPMELVDPLDYIEGYRRVTSIFINNAGTSYEAGTDVSTAGGSGTGLTVDIELGDFTNITINNPGTGYKVNDVVIVSGGDLNAEIAILDITHRGYPTTIFTKDFIKTDEGLKMINMVWDSESLTSYYYTNKYFDIDISLSNDGEILGATLSSYRDLNSLDSSSLE